MGRARGPCRCKSFSAASTSKKHFLGKGWERIESRTPCSKDHQPSGLGPGVVQVKAHSWRLLFSQRRNHGASLAHLVRSFPSTVGDEHVL